MSEQPDWDDFPRLYKQYHKGDLRLERLCEEFDLDGSLKNAVLNLISDSISGKGENYLPLVLTPTTSVTRATREALMRREFIHLNEEQEWEFSPKLYRFVRNGHSAEDEVSKKLSAEDVDGLASGLLKKFAAGNPAVTNVPTIQITLDKGPRPDPDFKGSVDAAVVEDVFSWFKSHNTLGTTLLTHNVMESIARQIGHSKAYAWRCIDELEGDRKVAVAKPDNTVYKLALLEGWDRRNCTAALAVVTAPEPSAQVRKTTPSPSVQSVPSASEPVNNETITSGPDWASFPELVRSRKQFDPRRTFLSIRFRITGQIAKTAGDILDDAIQDCWAGNLPAIPTSHTGETPFGLLKYLEGVGFLEREAEEWRLTAKTYNAVLETVAGVIPVPTHYRAARKESSSISRRILEGGKVVSQLSAGTVGPDSKPEISAPEVLLGYQGTNQSSSSSAERRQAMILSESIFRELRPKAGLDGKLTVTKDQLQKLATKRGSPAVSGRLAVYQWPKMNLATVTHLGRGQGWEITFKTDEYARTGWGKRTSGEKQVDVPKAENPSDSVRAQLFGELRTRANALRLVEPLRTKEMVEISKRLGKSKAFVYMTLKEFAKKRWVKFEKKKGGGGYRLEFLVDAYRQDARPALPGLPAGVVSPAEPALSQPPAEPDKEKPAVVTARSESTGPKLAADDVVAILSDENDRYLRQIADLSEKVEQNRIVIQRIRELSTRVAGK